MPNIPEYNNPVDRLQPSDLGTEAEVQAGRRIGSFYNEAGEAIGRGVSELGDQYVKAVTNEEYLTALANAAKRTAGLQAQWQQAMATDAASSVHDPNLWNDFQEKVVNPYYESVGKGLSTQEGRDKWAEERVHYQDHWNTVGMADMGSLVGAQQVQATREATAGTIQNAALSPELGLSADGFPYKQIDSVHDEHVAILGPNATPAAIDAIGREAETAKQQVLQASMKAGIDAAAEKGLTAGGPDLAERQARFAAQQFADSPAMGKYGSEALRNIGFEYAQRRGSELRTQFNADNSAQTLAIRRQITTAVSAIRDKGLNDQGIHVGYPGEMRDLKALRAQTGGDPEANKQIDEAQAAIKVGVEDIAHPEKFQGTNPRVFNDLMANSAMDASAWNRAYTVDKTISKEEYDTHIGQIDRINSDPAYKNLHAIMEADLAQGKTQFTTPLKSGGSMLSPKAAYNYYLYTTVVRNRIESAVKAGVPFQEIIQRYLTPAPGNGSNPTYLGDRGFVGGFVKANSMAYRQQAGQSKARAPRLPRAPRKPFQTQTRWP